MEKKQETLSLDMLNLKEDPKVKKILDENGNYALTLVIFAKRTDFVLIEDRQI